MKKKAIIILSISIIAVLVIFMGSSYALFSKTEQALNTDNYTTGILQIEYEGDGSLTLVPVPLTDKDGEDSEPYTFTIENVGNLNYQYDLKLLTDITYATSHGCLNNQVPSQYIKVKVDDNTPVLLSELTEGTFVTDKFIIPGEVHSYSIRVWLDISTPNSIIGMHFHGKIASEGQAVYESNGSQESKCPNGYEYIEEESYCVKEATLVQANSCPDGYITNGDVCQATLTCTDGYTLVGTTCQKTATVSSYSCSSGTVSGSNCIQNPGSYYECWSGELIGNECYETVTNWDYGALGPYDEEISCSGHRCTDAGYDGGSITGSAGDYYCDCYSIEENWTYADEYCNSCPTGWTRLNNSSCTCYKAATPYYTCSSGDTLNGSNCEYSLYCAGTLNGSVCSINKTVETTYVCSDEEELLEINGVNYCKVDAIGQDKNYLVSDGSNSYETLEEAINSQDTTKTLTMLGSTNECVVIPSGMDVTIDLSGNTITCNDTTITNNGNITINDSVGTGAVISTEAIAINNVSTGTVTISNGNIKGATYGIYNTTSGIINVGLSGTVSTIAPAIYATGTTGYGVYMNSGGTLNFNNGAIYTANTSVSSAYYKNNCTLNALSGYHINNTTTTIDGTSYKYSHLTSGSTVLQYRYRNEKCDWNCVIGSWTDEDGVGHIGCLPDEPYEYVCNMGSWSSWSTSNPGNQDECQKRTCNLDAEGNITTCGSSSSHSC